MVIWLPDTSVVPGAGTAIVALCAKTETMSEARMSIDFMVCMLKVVIELGECCSAEFTGVFAESFYAIQPKPTTDITPRL